MRRKHPEQLYTRPQVAKMLSVSVRTVTYLLRQGDRTKGKEGLWPYLRIGTGIRSLRIPESAIVRLQERTKVEV